MSFEDKLISRSLPVNVKETDLAFFDRLTTGEAQAPKIINIRKCYVFDKGVVFKNFSIVKQLLHQNDEAYFLPYNFRDFLKTFLLNKVVKLQDSKIYLLVTNLYASSYYHWLIEAVPRLFIIKDQIDTGTLLLPEGCNQGFHQELLKIFNVKETHVMRSGTAYKVNYLVSSTEIGKMANSHPAVLQNCAKFIKDNLSLTLNLGARIYVSRQKAAKRQIVNESQLVDFLKSLGFAIVCFEDYSFCEQVSITHHCKYLVGLHGAGLSNLIFMEKGGSVLELRKHDKGENYFFFTLAAAMDINYYYQFCDGISPHNSVQDDDIEVSYEEFKQNVYQMMQ